MKTICKVGIILNSAGLFFTSRVYKNIFIPKFTQNTPNNVNSPESQQEQLVHDDTIFKMETGWDALKFFMYIVIFEHLMLILQELIAAFKKTVPSVIGKEKRERKDLIDQFLSKKDNDDDFHASQDIAKTSENI